MYTRYFLKIIFFIASAMTISMCDASRCNNPERSTEYIFPISRKSNNVIRVLTYNIRGESPLDRKYGNTWESRKSKVSYLLQRYQPDLICLQGVKKIYMSDMQAFFPDYQSIMFDVNQTDHDVLLLVHTQRFTIEKQQCIWLCEEPLCTNTPKEPAWGGQHPRMVISTTLYDCRSHKKIVFMGTHFDSAGMESRIKSAHVLVQQVKQTDSTLPLIVAGDFNFIVTTPIIAEKSQQAYKHIITNTGLSDIRDSSDKNHYGPDGTWIGWPYDKYAAPRGTIGERLDNIFVRHCVVLQEGVLNLKIKSNLKSFIAPDQNEFIENAYSSDHLPVIADLLLL